MRAKKTRLKAALKRYGALFFIMGAVGWLGAYLITAHTRENTGLVVASIVFVVGISMLVVTMIRMK